jgi:AmmeMemoRadiSam system protein B
MTNIRNPSVAGSFYPADPTILATTIQGLLAKAPHFDLATPKALIAPHAGYIYSGPIAATIYKTLLPHKDLIRRVVLLGPAHRVAFDGIAVTAVASFVTPLGTIPVDTQAINSILALPNVKIFEQAYNMEHCLEVQLPFLQSVLTNFAIVPCIVGNTDPINVANIIKQLWGGADTLIVISSDLSHYYDYATAQQLDALTSKAIEQLAPDNIKNNQACGRLPVKGLLLAAKQLNLQPTVLDVRNSGDTAGDRNRVVGYGAYHFV